MTPARLLPIAALGLLLAPAAAAAAPPPTVQIDLGGTTLELVLIPKGSFTEGSPPTEKDRKDDEAAHKVTLSQDFYIGKYPVTRGQFARFATAAGYRTESEKGTSGGFGFDGKDLVQRKEFTWKNPGFPQDDTHPVTLVTYDDALAFTNWLSRLSGRTVTLPTEAQWEYAYRAGTSTPYHDAETSAAALSLGWFKENALGGTHPVGQKKPNRFGLYDMAGNVFEWCLDWYAPYTQAPAVDPLQVTPDPSDKSRRVLRGGSWFKEARNGRGAARNRNTPGSRNADNGFRVVAGLDVTSKAIPPSPSPTPPGSTPSSPPPPERDHSGAFAALGAATIGGGCCGTAGLFGLIFWLIQRGGIKRQISFRPGRDGFWISAPQRLMGATISYRYRAGGNIINGSVVIEQTQNGQFVYTGYAPMNIEVIDVLPLRRSPPRASGSSGRSGGPSWGRSSSSRAHSSHSSFQGYPPAY